MSAIHAPMFSGGDPSILVLMHFNGANDSTTFVDEKGHTCTAYDGAKISTTKSQFGGSSAFFDGVDDRVVIEDGGFTLPGDFYIGFFSGNLTSGGATNRNALSFIEHSAESFANGLQIRVLSGEYVVDLYDDSAANTQIIGDQSVHVPVSADFEWISVIRSGSTVSLYVAGVLAGSATFTAELIPKNITIGAPYEPVVRDWNGYIDELVIANRVLLPGTHIPTAQFNP